MTDEMMTALLSRPASPESLGPLIEAFDRHPVTAARHQEAALAWLAGWCAAPDAAIRARCAQAALRDWRPDRTRDAAVQEVFSGLEPQLRGDRQPFAPLQFDLALREVFAELGSPWVMENLHLPDTLLTYLRLAEGRYWLAEDDNPYALSLSEHEGIVANTRDQCETFRYDRQRDPAEGEGPARPASDFDAVFTALRELTPRSRSARGTGAWLDIGSYSDKHDMAICVHRLGDWGAVHDWHDAHPWLNGHNHGDREAADFLTYLRQLSRD